MRKNRGTAYGVIGLGRFGTALAIALAQAESPWTEAKKK